jgi:hypothetical protein
MTADPSPRHKLHWVPRVFSLARRERSLTTAGGGPAWAAPLRRRYGRTRPPGADTSALCVAPAGGPDYTASVAADFGQVGPGCAVWMTSWPAPASRFSEARREVCGRACRKARRRRTAGCACGTPGRHVPGARRRCVTVGHQWSHHSPTMIRPSRVCRRARPGAGRPRRGSPTPRCPFCA